MTYTAEQHAASARKYGITPGEWESDGEPGEGVVSIKSGDTVIAEVFQQGENDPIENGFSDETICNAKQIELLPRTLIERDALREDNERLRKALSGLLSAIDRAHANEFLMFDDVGTPDHPHPNGAPKWFEDAEVAAAFALKGGAA